MAQESSQTCMTCKEVNPPEYEFCGKCSAPLLRPQVQPIAQSSPQQEKYRPKTVVCPQCGNTNTYDARECLKCGLDLALIREAMTKATSVSKANVQTVESTPIEPARPLPQLPPRQTSEQIGTFVDSWRFLIRGMGGRSSEIAARFFKRLNERGITGLKLSIGKLIIQLDGGGTDSRDYCFAERDLGSSALATMAVRIAPVGTDLFVEWRQYALPSKEVDAGGMLFGIAALGVAGFSVLVGFLDLLSGHPSALFCMGVGGIAGLVGIVLVGNASTNRRGSLVGFQSQDSTAFQLTVRAALEEAIDLAGISKSLIQQMSSEPGKERRVI